MSNRIILAMSTFLILILIDAKSNEVGRMESTFKKSIIRGRGGLGWAFSGHFADPPSPYGNIFGRKGLPDNSYIFNNHYQNISTNKFLIESLLKTEDIDLMHMDSGSKSRYDYLKNWNKERDREWRVTTKSPYFENKIPGESNFLPASAAIGAATALGLVSLLPLNVLKGKPLMYHRHISLNQSPIRIDNEDIYACKNKSFYKYSCSSDNSCIQQKIECDLNDRLPKNLYCLNDTLYSPTSIYCNSTSTLYSTEFENITIINCYQGLLSNNQASFIPTTSTTTEFSLHSTTPKPLSFNANVHVFLLKLMGRTDVLETTTKVTTTESYHNSWHPEALTIPTKPATRRTKPK